MKITHSVLVLALALMNFGSSTAGDSLQKGPEVVQKNAESQQISVEASTDLDKAATGYDGGFKKGSTLGHYDIADFKGAKGYNDDRSYHVDKQGDDGKLSKAGYHDKGGKSYHGNDHQNKYYGNHKHGVVGSKGHDVGIKGHQKKGHKNKGFKNLYHKEEYGVNKVFYDDDDFTKYHSDHDQLDDHYASQKGGFQKGSNYKGGENHNLYGDKGSFEKDKYFDSNKGLKGSHGSNKHYGHDSNFDKKGGNIVGHGHSLGGHGGYGHGNLGYGVGGHNGGYGSAGHHGGYGSGNLNGGFGHGTVGHHGGLGYGSVGHQGGFGGRRGGYGHGNGLNHLEHGHGLNNGVLHGGFRGGYNNLGGHAGGYGHSNNIGGSGLQSGYGHLGGDLGGYAVGHSNFNMKYR